MGSQSNSALRRFGALAFVIGCGAGVAAVSGSARTGQDGIPTPAAFRTADDSVACALFDSGALACRSVAAPSAIVLEPNGRSRAADVDIPFEDATVLAGGEGWWNGDVACRATEASVHCTNGRGAIAVDRDRVAGAL